MFALMAAGPEDVGRCRIGGKWSEAGIQVLRDLEAVWGIRFLIRKVEGVQAIAAGNDDGRDHSDESDESDEDEDDEDEEVVARKQSRQVQSNGKVSSQSIDEYIVSCRGVGVRGARKAT